ncbi:MAG: hypothetical protein Q7S79_03320 [bacterium]|nr:hypothetical protein [bacterium]
MPKKKKSRLKRKKFSINHKRVFRRLFTFAAIVSLTWGVWKILDHFLWPGNPLIGGLVVVVGALLYLFLDDFHLKELE